MKNKMISFLEYIGFVMMLIGFAGVDGNNAVLSIVIGFAGIAILYTSAKIEYPHGNRPKHHGNTSTM